MGYVAAAAVAAGTAGVAAWAARGRASSVFAPSVWRGPGTRRAMALTFDDGPSEGTADLLALLDGFGARATFFQCGANAERLPEAAKAVSDAGHEIGNHTYSHPALWLRGPEFIAADVGRAQATLTGVHGRPPRLFRAPYGVRWPGLGAAQRTHGLLGVMWSTIGRDWTAAGDQVAARLTRGAMPGAIFCLHDGRGLAVRPDISVTLTALRRVLPEWRAAGYELVTVSELLGPGRSGGG